VAASVPARAAMMPMEASLFGAVLSLSRKTQPAARDNAILTACLDGLTRQRPLAKSGF
jgi:hypothetical protein